VDINSAVSVKNAIEIGVIKIVYNTIVGIYVEKYNKKTDWNLSPVNV